MLLKHKYIIKNSLDTNLSNVMFSRDQVVFKKFVTYFKMTDFIFMPKICLCSFEITMYNVRTIKLKIVKIFFFNDNSIKYLLNKQFDKK